MRSSEPSDATVATRPGSAIRSLRPEGQPAVWEVVDQRLEHDEQGETFLDLVAERDYGEFEDDLANHELEHAQAARELGIPTGVANTIRRAQEAGLAVELVTLEPGELPDWAAGSRYPDALIIEEIEDDLLDMCGVGPDAPRATWLTTVKERLPTDLDRFRADVEGDHLEIEEWDYLDGRVFASVGTIEDESDPDRGTAGCADSSTRARPGRRDSTESGGWSSTPHRHRHVVPESLPAREELDALARHYHHLRNEHQRASAESSVRRQLEEGMLEVHERFERVLEEWVPESELREAWLEYLKNRTAEPEGPPPIQPLAFSGVHETSGSVAEVRGRDDDAQVWVDGTLVERVVAQKDFTQEVSPAVFRADGMEFVETYDTSLEATRHWARIDATARSRPGSTPPNCSRTV